MADRAQQIRKTAIPVIPADVDTFRATRILGPTTGFVVAAADFAWLLDMTRIAEQAIRDAALSLPPEQEATDEG